jgi:carbamoyltransferase
MLILGAYDRHDASAAVFEDYRLKAAVALERLTRIKGDGYRFPAEAVDECLSIAGATRRDVDIVCLPRTKYEPRYFHRKLVDVIGLGGLRSHELVREMAFWGTADPLTLFDGARWLADHGFRPDVRIHFYNHHKAHALAALFHMQSDDAVAWTADGYGDRVYYSLYRLKDGQLTAPIGGEAESLRRGRAQKRESAMGRLYHDATEALGFRPMRHEGKVLGLAAFGQPVFFDELRAFYRVTPDGRIEATASRRTIRDAIRRIAKQGPRDAVAASVQGVLESVMLEAMDRIVGRDKPKGLGVAGGVFSNVKLNQRLAERFPFEEVFVYPAMTDCGEPAGGVLDFLLVRDGLPRWLGERYSLSDVYFGRDYDAVADEAFRGAGATAVATGDVATAVAGLVADGKIVGTYLGRMEYGPRALGARTILASATDRRINDWMNKRLDRTEFMPFAPVVRADRVAEPFLLGANMRYSARFMTITCDVAKAWQERIPAVVHVDGTARPQLVEREQNPVYHDILTAYEKQTGLPVLINTSFNAHEEPIINAPGECVKALKDGRVDYVATKQAVWSFAPTA